MAAVTKGWKLGVLGGFNLTYNDHPVSFTHGTARILAYLAMQERPQRRVHVAWTLWGELNDRHALAALRSALWRLPHEPGHPIVDCGGHHLALDRHVTVDLAAANSLLAALAAGDELPAVTDLTPLMQDILPDWYDDWIVFPREQLRQRRLHSLETVSQRYITERNFDRAIEFALRAVECEPLRESAHRCLIAAHLAEGNLTEAIRQRHAYLIRLTEADLPPVCYSLDALMRVAAVDAGVRGSTASPRTPAG